MPHTFSLARLLLAVTTFCLLCGLAVNFPPAGTFITLFAPAIIVWLVFVRYSGRMVENSTIALLGALSGLIVCSIPIRIVLFLVFRLRVRTNAGSNQFADMLDLISFSVGMGLGVLLVCAASALDHKFFPTVRRQAP